MAKGIIYIMTSIVPGLIKIGKTGSANFEQRMYNLEHNGYNNVTGMRRVFAIEVENYDEKEALLHTIFTKSQVADSELFALDINIAIQLLSSFDGTQVYPKNESKAIVFEEATENTHSKFIPDGKYYFKRKKASDNKTVYAEAEIKGGVWTLKKGSDLGVTEDVGVSQKARAGRALLPTDSSGVLLEDYELGLCSPSFAGSVVMNSSCNGWSEWKNAKGQAVDIYRKK